MEDDPSAEHSRGPFRFPPFWGVRREHPIRRTRLADSAVNSTTFSALSKVGVASFEVGDEYFLEVGLDGGRSRESLDMRPEIPLRLRW